MKNLYLDVDGVLITKDKQPAKHLIEFLEFVVGNFNCYWLTTHCKGSARNLLSYLEEILPEEAIGFLEEVKATNWKTFKTEAIDFSKDFYWLDDQLFDSEKKVLEERGALDKLVKIDLEENPDQLLEFMK